MVDIRAAPDGCAAGEWGVWGCVDDCSGEVVAGDYFCGEEGGVPGGPGEFAGAGGGGVDAD